MNANASIYRINVLNIIISQLICTYILYSMHVKKSEPIKCNVIYVWS